MALNLGSLLANSASRYGDNTAAIFHERRMTYAQMDSAARRLAADMLRRGLKQGQKAAIMAPNLPEFTIAYFGALYAGAVVVPLNILLSADEVEYQLNDAEAKFLILYQDYTKTGLEGFGRAKGCHTLYWLGDGAAAKAPEGAVPFAEVIRSGEEADLAQTMPDDEAVILYTSGTTGKPKGAVLSHFNLYFCAQQFNERVWGEWPEKINVIGPGHVGLAVLPLYHSFGQSCIQNGCLFGGAAVSYVTRFTPEETMRIIARDKVTLFAGVPTMHYSILHSPELKSADFSSLRHCITGGAAIPVEVKGKCEAMYGIPIQEGYGLSETSPLATVQLPSRTHKAGSIGTAIAGVEVMIGDEKDQPVPVGERGEILIRGLNIMLGYYNKPQATAEAMRNGWFHSGDIGFADADGDLYIVDRVKDMILRGGYNVYPREVEEVLYTHPAIMEAAVVGVPDDRLGEETKAVVALKPGATASAEEIVAFCKEHLAAYKYPRIVEFIDTLPKGPTGKILKRELRTK